MEYSGFATDWDEIVFRGDPATPRVHRLLAQPTDRVLAGMNVNVWDVSDPIQALIRSKHPVDPARLADPEVPLADLVKTA